ncbi:hypothetical protein F4861DRAFT_536318 [Xylaria intraflava]|nr:hypothetical protein F4861DRAFT_536318 [Xylaria intraflava]
MGMEFRYLAIRMLLGILLSSGVATAQPDNSNTQIGMFNVTYFQASGTPHSLYGIIIVNWTTAADVPATWCETRPAGSPSFPTTGKTACAGNPTMSFSVGRMGDGSADLELWYEPPSAPSRYGIHHTSQDEISVIPGLTPTGDVEVYGGPLSFTVDST